MLVGHRHGRYQLTHHIVEGDALGLAVHHELQRARLHVPHTTHHIATRHEGRAVVAVVKATARWRAVGVGTQRCDALWTAFNPLVPLGFPAKVVHLHRRLADGDDHGRPPRNGACHVFHVHGLADVVLEGTMDGSPLSLRAGATHHEPAALAPLTPMAAHKQAHTRNISQFVRCTVNHRGNHKKTYIPRELAVSLHSPTQTEGPSRLLCSTSTSATSK